MLIQLLSIIKSNSFFANFRFSSLVQDVAIPKDENFEKLLSGQTLHFEFKANDYNLGTIEFLFNNYKKINSDIVVFKIKEKGVKDWYYQSSHESSKFDIGQFYPFGFPPIPNSKNRYYEIEIVSLFGKTDNSISLSRTSDFFQVKYFYSKAFLTKNIWLTPHFLITKLVNCLGLLKYNDFVNLGVIFVLPLLGYFAIKAVIKILIYFYPKNIKLKRVDLKKIVGFIKARIVIISIVIFYSLTHLRFLTYSQYWDANLYWNSLQGAIDKFLHTPLTLKDLAASFLANFNISGHPSMGYISLMSLSQLFGRGSVVHLNIENMLLAVMAIWAFYNIVRFFYPSRIYENLLVTLIFAFNPLFYATSISFNTDFPLLVFMILLTEAFINKRKFWYLIWAMILIFSKETGVLIYFMFVLFYSAFYALKRRAVLRWENNIIQMLLFCLPLLTLSVYFIYTHGRLWNNNDYLNFNLVWGNSCNFCFGLNQNNVKVRLFQIFIMNFSWIVSSIILVSVYKSLITGSKFSKILSKEKLNFIKVLILTFFAFVLFNLVTVVMNFSRYEVAGVFFLILIFYVSLNNLSLSVRVRLVVLTAIFLLVLIQTFKAIDPSPRFLYGTNYLGRNISSPIFGFNDAMVYNTQFVFVDGLTDLINKDTPEGTKLINDIATSYFYRNLNNVGMIEDFKDLEKKGYKDFRYILIPWMSDGHEFLKQINILFKVKKSKTLDYKGYYVEVYDLESI